MSASSPRSDENVFRLLVESAKDYAIFLLDPKGIVTTWNEGAARIKGYRAEEIIGKHFSVFYPPEDVAAGKCEHELVVAEAEGRFEDEGLRVRKDGSTFHANVIITPSRDSSGALIGFTKVTRDLTERIAAENERLGLAQATAARVEAERSLARLLRLQELGTLFSRAQSPDEIIDLIVRKGADALSAVASTFMRPRGDEVETVLMTGLGDDIHRQFRRFPATIRLLSSTPLETARPEWVETTEELARRFPDTPRIEQVGAACALPLVINGRAIASVAFRFTDARTFSPNERAFLETFATQAAQALERAEAQMRDAESRRRLEALSSLAEALSSALTPPAVARIIVETGRRVTGADTCTLHRLDTTIPALVLLDERGCNPEIARRIQRMTRDPSSPSWQAVETTEGLWVETEAEYGALYPSLRGIPSEAPRSRAFWAMPLVSEGKSVGLLGMGFHGERSFPPEERQFIATFTRHCSDALLRAHRLEDEQQARASLATTLRSIGDAVIATDAKGVLTMMNPVAERLTGWTEAEARGRPLADIFVIVNEQTRATVVSPVDKVLELGTIVGLANHTVLIAKDGKRERPIDDSGAPIRGTDGRIEGVVLVFRDVTEKKLDETRRSLLEQAGAALAASLDYELTLSNVARLAVPRFADWCGVDILDEQGGPPRQVAVAHINPAKIEWARELGRKFPPDPSAPHGVPNVLRTGKSELYAEVTEEMIRMGARNEEHLKLSLELHLRSVIIVPLLAHGRTLGAMTFLWAESDQRYSERDVSFAEELASRCANAIDNARIYDAEQRARSAADLANRAKDEFLAMVSHELRTPLNAIMGWAKLLSSGTLDGPKQERAIGTIDRNAVAMAQLIEDLLDISRIISGKMRLEIQSLQLGRVVEAAIDAVRPAADAKEIEIVERTDVDAQSLNGDPTRLQQVVWNLLSNAVKFTPRNGKIEIELVRTADGIEIVVIDNGKGIDPGFLPHVFDPFRQEDASHTRSRGGLGLGLAITKQLVELHGGNVSAESEGEGRGATFRVFLPALSSGPGVLQRTGRNRRFRLDSVFQDLPRLKNIHALVVDDEEDARILVKAILEELDARVTLAASAAEALDAIAKERPTILVSDIGMPVQDGYDLLAAVRKLPAAEGGNTPAIAVTAYARAEDRRRALDAGFAMHVSKPVDPAELVAAIVALTLSKNVRMT